MSNAWAHLPNAKHIDRILADARVRPEVWHDAWTDVWRTNFPDVHDRLSARAASRLAFTTAGRAPANDAAFNVASGALKTSGRDAIRALIAWDDSADLLSMPVDAVRLLAASGHHPAVLLLPACIVLNQSSKG